VNTISTYYRETEEYATSHTVTYNIYALNDIKRPSYGLCGE